MDVVVERQDRRFQMWSYSVSLSRLLLRSTKSETFQTRVDVLFHNVKALKLPISLDGLTVTRASTDQAAQTSAETGILVDSESQAFIVRSGSMSGFVVTGVCVEHEDVAEHFDPSPIWVE